MLMVSPIRSGTPGALKITQEDKQGIQPQPPSGKRKRKRKGVGPEQDVEGDADSLSRFLILVFVLKKKLPQSMIEGEITV